MSDTKNVVVTRTFNAPVAKVWKAWTESELVKQWWGPNGFSCPVANMDVREGGTSLVCMRAGADMGGIEIYNTWSYTKVVPNERLEYILNFADKNGTAMEPSKMGMPAGVPKDVPHVIEFKSHGDKTEVTVTEKGYTSDEAVAISTPGLEQCLDKMATLLA